MLASKSGVSGGKNYEKKADTSWELDSHFILACGVNIAFPGGAEVASFGLVIHLMASA